MNYKVKILSSAFDDLNNYIDYLERKTFSIEKANQEMWFILQNISKLSFMPFMYPKIYKDFHFFTYKSLKIFFKIYKKDNLVVVFRILWDKQNYEEIL